MAGLRPRRARCIRAGFQKRQTHALHRFKANCKKNHVGFAERIWREVRLQETLSSCQSAVSFLDPYGDSEDTLGRSAYSFFTNCSLGDVTCDLPSHVLKSRRPVHLQDLLSGTRDLVTKAASGAPASPEANDVAMQPAEAGSPKARASAARLSGSPADSRMMEEDWGARPPAVEPPPTGRRAEGRARVPRPPPRLGNERDKGPKLSLSKRKLELLLAEPEKNKRKRQDVA